MSFEKAKYANLWAWEYNTPVFGGGLVEDMEDWRIKDGSTPYMRNGRLIGMRTERREWYTALRTWWDPWTKTDVNGTVTANGDHYGAGSHIQHLHYSVGTLWNTDRLLALYQDPTSPVWLTRMSVIDDDLYNETITKVPLGTYTYSTLPTRFNSVEVNDEVFFFNKQKAPFKYNTDTKVATESCITVQSPDNSNMRPWFGTIFDGRMWVAWDYDNPNELYRSSQSDVMNFWYPAPTTTPSYGNYDNGGTLKFNERITGLSTTAQALFVFTPKTVSVTYQNSEQVVGSAVSYPFAYLEAKEGCTNNATIVPVNNQLYYLSGDNKIMVIERQRYWVYVAQGLSNRLGKALDKTMGTLDKNQDSAFGFYSPLSDEIRWHVKTQWSSVNDLVVIYNVQKDEFYFDDGKPFYHAAAGSGKVYTAWQLKPIIWEDENGWRDWQLTLESWLGNPINFKRLSKRFTFWDPTLNKEFWQARTFARMQSDTILTQKLYIDGELVSTKNILSNDFSSTVSNIPYSNDYLYDCVIVVDKDELYKRWRWMQVLWEASNFVSLENFDVKLEGLNQLTTDYK